MAQFREYTVIEAEHPTLLDNQDDFNLQLRATDESGSWRVEKLDAYHGDWYPVEGRDTFVLKSEAIARLKEIVEGDDENI